jgi:hypothetical protein
MDMQNQMQQSRNKKFTEGAKPSKQRAASRWSENSAYDNNTGWKMILICIVIFPVLTQTIPKNLISKW